MHTKSVSSTFSGVVEKSSKIAQEKESLISVFADIVFVFKLLLPNVASRRETGYRAMSSSKFEIFPIFPNFQRS